jgi:hypothetical protein
MPETNEKVPVGTENIKKRMRSPNYPMFSLSDGLTKIKLIFDAEKRNLTPADVILNHLGYKKDSGTGGRAISALRQYGLLEDTSGNYRVSDLAYGILFGEEGSSDVENDIRISALKPLIFSEIVATYAGGLPSDASLKSFLITKKGFNPDSVEEFIRVFKETISLAKVIPGEYDLPSGEDSDMPTPSSHEGARITVPTPGGTQVQIFNFGLSQPRKVRAEIKLVGQEFKQEDVELLIEHLQLLKRSFEKGTN